MKVFFIGIFNNQEPNHMMRQAIKEIATGGYQELSHTDFRDKIVLNRQVQSTARKFLPNLVFMQLQAPNILSEDTINLLKRTGATVVQWTGDARQPTPSHYFEVGKKIDLSFFGNTEDVDALQKQGIKADYLNISVDHTIYNPQNKSPKVVFMGNNYNGLFPLSEFRLAMCRFLKKEYGSDFQVYGSGYPADLRAVDLMYKHEKEADAYRNCKIAINCSHFDLGKYTSDRLFRILFSGAFCLTKEFPQMETYLTEGKIFDSFTNLSELKEKIDYYLQNDSERNTIAQNGYNYAIKHEKWSDRMQEMLKLIEKWKNTGQTN